MNPTRVNFHQTSVGSPSPLDFFPTTYWMWVLVFEEAVPASTLILLLLPLLRSRSSSSSLD
eukprot:3913454-Karenia_brevis.AAC.1